MAKEDYMASMTELSKRVQAMSEEQVLIERFKIEDAIFMKYDVEIEHIL
jgi:hypothetical protein